MPGVALRRRWPSACRGSLCVLVSLPPTLGLEACLTCLPVAQAGALSVKGEWGPESTPSAFQIQLPGFGQSSRCPLLSTHASRTTRGECMSLRHISSLGSMSPPGPHLVPLPALHLPPHSLLGTLPTLSLDHELPNIQIVPALPIFHPRSDSPLPVAPEPPVESDKSPTSTYFGITFLPTSVGSELDICFLNCPDAPTIQRALCPKWRDY